MKLLGFDSIKILICKDVAYILGDFIQESIKVKVEGKMMIKLAMFRIVATYQACRYFIGNWVQDDEPFQKWVSVYGSFSSRLRQ